MAVPAVRVEAHVTPCLDSNGTPKGTYDNRTTAERFKMKRLRENPTLDLRVYRCGRCGKFHLTHLEDRKMEEAS